MDRELAIALLPQLIWSVVVLILVLVFRDAIRQRLGRVRTLSFLGFSVELEPEQVKAAVKARAKLAGTALQGLDSVASSLVSRAERLQPVLRGAVAVWLDEDPLRNRTERRLLREMGVFTQVIRELDEAGRFVESEGDDVDLVISENLTQDGRKVGQILIGRLGHARPPVILYVTNLKPGLPEGAFGITNRPDELLHLVMDALERSPRAAARSAAAASVAEPGCSVRVIRSHDGGDPQLQPERPSERRSAASAAATPRARTAPR
jgi:hypothetical protein